ncbi:MAG: T9SS type A sorting domain-containing protein [Saprospiraceae bacterium]
MKTGILILIISYAFISPAWSQNVSLDPTFGADGNGYVALSAIPDPYTEMALRTDGRIVMFGTRQFFEYEFIILAGRTPSGLPDSTFGNNGFVTLGPFDFEDGIPREIIILPSGKFLICGYFYNETKDVILLLRLLEDGTIDSTFAQSGVQEFLYEDDAFPAWSFTTDDQENIFLIGMFHNQQAIQKLMPDGSTNLTFGNNGIALMPVYEDSVWEEWGSDIVILPDGNFLTTAKVLVDDSNIGFVASRWNPDGTVDKTFGHNGSIFFDTGSEVGVFLSIHPQPDGKILYKDYFSYFQNMRLFRLDQNGMPDLSFGDKGSVFMDSVFGPITNDGLLICSDGSFLMPYSMDVEDMRHNYLGRFHTNFSVDTSFGNEGRFELPAEIFGLISLSILFQEENKTILNVISGDNFSYYTTLIRLNVDNHVNTSVIPSANSLISLSPNPSRDRIVIHFNNTETVSANLELIDNQGRILQKLAENLHVDVGENQFEFELADDIPPGIVYVKLNTGSAEQIYPLMIIP